MKPCVVDASVVATAFFNEEHAERATALLLSTRELHAPDLICTEIANVIWKRRRRGEVNEEEAGQLLSDFLRLPLRITPAVELVESALQLAMRTGRTVYDCLYLALAVTTGAAMVTADRRLVNSLAGTPLGRYVVWIGKHR